MRSILSSRSSAVERRKADGSGIRHLLFDLDADADERTDLAPAPPTERLGRALETLVDDLREKAVTGSGADLSPEAIAELKALGYLGGDD